MKNPLVICVPLFIITVLCGSVFGQMWNYLPLTKTELGKPFAMKRVGPPSDGRVVSFTLPAGPSGIHFGSKSQNPAFSIAVASGKDTKNRNWRADVPLYCQFPSDFYVGDLDGNNITDLLILVPTCGSGLAPTVHLFVLLFDEKGRPVPFEADGFFEGLANGIDALVDMDRDGKAELVYMNFNDGYWITNIYRSENARWHRIQGQFAGKEYPLFTRFTSRPNREAVLPRPDKHPFAPDLSTDTPLLAGQLLSFKIPEKKGTDVELNVLTSDGSHVVCTPAYWYGSVRVVLDGPGGRQISDLSRENRENVSPILNKIISEKLRVLFYGKRYRDRCSPEILWATENN
jgi:hypothetical protein